VTNPFKHPAKLSNKRLAAKIVTDNSNSSFFWPEQEIGLYEALYNNPIMHRINVCEIKLLTNMTAICPKLEQDWTSGAEQLGPNSVVLYLKDQTMVQCDSKTSLHMAL
jgi:hypothetical protein